MNIQLSEHFTYSKLLKFTLPSMVMMVFTSIYGVVDGVFVSNYVGSESFAAVNLIMPFLMILGAVGFMLGSGGSALVSYTLGTGDSKRANEIFSLLIYVLIGLGAVFTVGGILFLAPMSRFLGADETMLPICVSYGRIVLSAMIPFMLQSTFQSFLVTAERPNLGLYVTVAAGVAKMTHCSSPFSSGASSAPRWPPLSVSGSAAWSPCCISPFPIKVSSTCAAPNSTCVL